MNILVVNDDGADAIGLDILRRAASRVYADARIITLTTAEPMGGQAMSLACLPLEDVPLRRIETDFYSCRVRPADLIYLAFCQPERLSVSGTFDLVLSGVNHGANVGLDVIHSGTVGMAMLANYCFGVTAVAFSQAFEDNDAERVELPFLGSDAMTHVLLRGIDLRSRDCININFPVGRPRGMRRCRVAKASRFRTLERQADATRGVDLVEIHKGFISCSKIALRI